MPATSLRLEAEQLADAVVLVDDVVAGAELGEGLERAAGGRGAAARAAAEDLRVGKEREAELAPDEAAPGRRDREEELGLGGQPLAGLEQPRLDAAQEVLRAQRLAPVRERDDDAEAAADERAELVLGLGEAARGDRGPLRLERERLARTAAGRARPRSSRRTASSCSSLPDLADLSGCQTRSGPAGTGHEVAGTGPAAGLVVGERGSTRSRRRSAAG